MVISNVLRISILSICLFGVEAQSQAFNFSAAPPPRESIDPGVLLEVASDTVMHGLAPGRAVNKRAVRRGEPLRVIVDGRALEYGFDRIVETNGEAITWIGHNSAQERIFVTLSPGAAYVDIQAEGRVLHIVSEYGAARVLTGTTPREVSERRDYRMHRRALALDKLKPTGIREDAVTGRIRRIRAAGLGHVEGDEFVPSTDYLDALALGHGLDLRPLRGGSGEMSPTWAYKTYDQYLNGVRVSSPVRIIYNRLTSEVTGVISSIYSEEDAPKPAAGDVAAESAQELAQQALAGQYGYEDHITATVPQLVYGDVGGELKLLWTVKLRLRGAPFVAFVNAKTGASTVRSIALPTNTCTANGSSAMQCTDAQATLIIGSNGQCLSGCGSPVETAHREAVRLYEEALLRYQQRGFAGYENNLDPDVEIVTDSAGLQQDSLAETHIASDFDTQIVVRDMNVATDPRVMYHETAHVYTVAKNHLLDPDSPGYTPGMHALDEAIAYILDQISRGTIAGLEHPNAHVNNYVDNFASANSNAMILEQAFYKWISTPNSTDMQMVERILLRSIPLLSQCSGSNCLYIVDAVSDVLEVMDDNDEVTGPQETAIKNDFLAAMGSVGLGHLAQPPGGTPPPPPPVPSTPFLAHQFYGCAGAEAWWTILWAPVQNADSYPVYADLEYYLGTDTAAPAFIGILNMSTNVHIHACGPGGCSGHSNSVPVSDVCQ